MTINHQIRSNLKNKVLIQEKIYTINTDFRVAIECDRIINDVQIDDADRGILITGLLFGADSPYCQEALDKATIYLSVGETEKSNQKRLIDFAQHWDLIYSAFLGQYNIDLYETNLHYYQFVFLLRGLKNTALTDVVDILSRNPSDEKDIKTRRRLVEAQNKLKIKNQPKQAPVNSAFLDQLSDEVKGGKHG